MKKLLYIIVPLAVLFTACQKDEEIGGTAVEVMAGDWFVNYSDDNGQSYSDGYYLLSTYNTADNSSTEMWIDDHGLFGPFKGRVNVNLSNMTFNTADSVDNEYMVSRFMIKEGKIIKNGTRGPGSGTPTDSIFLQIEFGNEPGVPYHLSGYRKTGFVEDEH